VIRLSAPQMTGGEVDAVRTVLDSGYIGPGGLACEIFERDVAAIVGVPHALATTSGTSALHLALLCAGVRPGDRVWCSTLTFIATANAIRHAGAVPVFVDCDSSWQIDAERVVECLDIAAKTGSLPRALVAVHLYGEPFFGEIVAEVCSQHGVMLIEDACQALGAGGACSFGDFAALSFNSNKIITTGGGGMLLCRSSEARAHAETMSQAGRPSTALMTRHVRPAEVGFNYRMSNVLAALGSAQLPALPARVAARRDIGRRYREALPDWGWQPRAGGNGWLASATVPAGEDRDAVLGRLQLAGIEARPVFLPMHQQPIYAACPRIGGAEAERIARDGLSLPSTPGTDVGAVVKAIRG
jgi:dTDP-4-amino-4,6-dideoxygalactose transaminase